MLHARMMNINSSRLVHKLQRAGASINIRQANQPPTLMAAAKLIDEVIVEVPPEMGEITKLLELARDAIQALNENPVTDVARLVDAIGLALKVSVQFLSSTDEERPDYAAEVSATLLRKAMPRSAS